MENQEKQFYSPQDAAKVLDVNPYTILRLIKSGRLHATNLGAKNRKMYRISAEDLKAFINQGRHEPTNSNGPTQNP